MGRLDGLVAIVTGAARGQGTAEARLFVAEGAKVILTDVLSEKGAEIANEMGPNAKFLCHDVGSAEGWDEVVAEALSTFGRIDILVNNAAIVRPLRLEATEPSDYDDMYRVNQFGVYLGMRAVIEPMKRQGGGSIINISSVAGLTGTSSLFAYCATKWAVRGMTRSAAKELARYQIRVNGIFPGVIDTPMNDGNSDKMNQGMIQATPLRRMGEVDEIAQAVLYFASPSSAFTTGAELAIDGGLSA